jgi:hypothetical protein
MNLYFNADDGMHLEHRTSTVQMAKRGIFLNVKPANDDNQSGGELEYQKPKLHHLENNRSITPTRKRDAFTKTHIRKVIFSIAQHSVHSFATDSSYLLDFMQITTHIFALSLPKIMQNVFFDCLKPIYNFLRAMGVFPQTRFDDTGEFQFSIKSQAMVYSLGIFIFFTVR